MKTVFVALCAIGCAYAAVDEASAPIVRSDFQNSPEGNFQYNYETGNGIVAQVEGKMKQLGKDELALEVHGSSQYQSPEGEKIQLTYVADENGYQPQGAHLPTTPPPVPIPSYIARSLEYIAAHPYQEKTL